MWILKLGEEINITEEKILSLIRFNEAEYCGEKMMKIRQGKKK